MSDEYQFELPKKTDSILATLNSIYREHGDSFLQQIVVNAQPRVHEQWSYDNWNGGTYGHALTLYLPESLFVKALSQREELCRQLIEDIGKLSNVPNEHFAEVFLEMQAAENPDWRHNSGMLVPNSSSKAISPDTLKRIWGDAHVRVFLSHRSEVQRQTAEIKKTLGRLGIGCFVAHEDVEPTEDWQREIVSALHSMDVLVALLTPDFHESLWTDQEVGVACGRNVPIIAVCLGRDPYGFIGDRQGVKGLNLEDPESIALQVYSLLHKRLPDKSRLFEAALQGYAGSQSWSDSGWRAKNAFSVFESLDKAQVERVLQTYRDSHENLHSFDGRGVLMPLLKKWTGKTWVVRDNELQEELPS